MCRVVFVESSFKITTFLEFIHSFAMFFKLMQWSLVLIAIRIFYYSITDYIIFVPHGFDFESLLRKISEDIFSITIFFTIFPITNKLVIGNLYHLSNTMLFTLHPLSSVNLSSFNFTSSNTVHFFAVFKLSTIV